MTLLAAAPLWAQQDAAVRSPNWVLGTFASGGNGMADRTAVHFARAGVRAGRVLTEVSGNKRLSGTFEYDIELTPVDTVVWNGWRTVYGAGITPVVMKWNFTHAQHTVPYFVAQAGFLWSSRNVPRGDTAHTNFVTGGGLGANWFVRPNRSLNFDVRATHLSNASIGNHNPGVNASLQVQIGYNWWRP